MNIEKIRIDWHDQFEQLQPYIKGKGGIVSINYYGDPCAPNAFVATLRSIHDSMEAETSSSKSHLPSHTIIISHENFETRYLSDLRGEFEQCLGIKLSHSEAYDERLKSTIGSNNSSDGDQHIETHLHFSAETEVGKSVSRDRWVESLCVEIREILVNRRVMVVLMHGKANEQHEFWDKLWNKGMRNLIENGLVLVRMIDKNESSQTNKIRVVHSNTYVDLPTYLDATQQKTARKDIADWIISELQIGVEQADAYAHSFVQANRNEINRIHDSVGFWIEGLRNTQ